MRQQKRHVNRAKPSGIVKVRDRMDREVVGEITNQKNRRGAKCRDHAVPMRDLPLLPNESIAEKQENRAQSIERAVEGRQILEAHGSRANVRSARRICFLWLF